MYRCSHVKADVASRDGPERLPLPRDGSRGRGEWGFAPRAPAYKSFSVMGKSFDPAKPDDYLASFKIRKSS